MCFTLLNIFFPLLYIPFSISSFTTPIIHIYVIYISSFYTPGKCFTRLIGILKQHESFLLPKKNYFERAYVSAHSLLEALWISRLIIIFSTLEPVSWLSPTPLNYFWYRNTYTYIFRMQFGHRYIKIL